MVNKPLSKGLAVKFVNKFIGTPGGDLSGFSYRTLGHFFPEYCDLDIDVDQYQGTKAVRFTDILLKASPRDQARILRGLLKKCPVGEEYSVETRTEELANEIRAEIRRLEAVSPVDAGALTFSVEVVERALKDAEILIQESDATSAVDRVHTAIHGFVRGLCAREGIALPADAGLTFAFKSIREGHPAFRLTGPHPEEVQKIQRAVGAMFDAMGTIRNRGSMAHANEDLIAPEEAMLIVNLARSILHYLDSKLPNVG